MNKEKALETLDELESLVQEKIVVLGCAVRAVQDRASEDGVHVLNARHNYVFYRRLIWQIKEELK